MGQCGPAEEHEGETQMSVPVWAALWFAAWTLLILLLGVGVHRWSQILTGRSQLKDFPGDEPHGPPLYRRASRAHANCIENLPVFAVIVFAAEVAGAHSQMLDLLSMAVVAARVAQTSTHLVSVSNRAIAIRFSFYSVQFIAFVWMGVIIMQHAMG
jgi:uncharacterized membrane protein YecN with MAPEG domain